MKLSRLLEDSPTKSEFEIFESMITKLSRLQRQLPGEYHKDTFLKDRMLRAMGISQIRQSMRERQHVMKQLIISLHSCQRNQTQQEHSWGTKQMLSILRTADLEARQRGDSEEPSGAVT